MSLLRMSRLLPALFLSVFVAASGVVRAQVEEETSPRGKGGKGVDSEFSTRGAEDQRLENMTPEQRLEHQMRRGSRGQCQFVAACQPARMMPGQSGTLRVTAILRDRFVLPSPAPVTVVPAMQSGAAEIGELVALPAAPGRLARAYLGQPVYENTAVFEAPVTIGTGATIGEKQPIAFDLKFDLYDGETGQALGRFLERVSTEVEIAPTIDPQVEGRTTPVAKPPVQPAAAPVRSGPTAAADQGDSREAPVTALSGTAGTVAASDGVAEPAAPVGGGEQPVVVEGGVPTLLLVGGGALLLLIVLLLLRRR